MTSVTMRNVIAVLCATGLQTAIYAYDASWDTEPLTPEEKARFEQVSRMWIGKLWTNDYSGCKAGFDVRRYHSRKPWTTYVDVSFRLHGKLCICGFIDKDPDKLNYIRNDLYYRSVHYTNDKDHPAVHTTLEQARAKVSELAALFGVSNLWDKTQFITFTEGGFDQSYEYWTFNFTAVKNGYWCPLGVRVNISDFPSAPLAKWHSGMYSLPDKFPTNVVLSAEHARAKSLEYMKKYFPFQAAALYRGQLLEKGDVLEIHCITNMLEYVTPNYHYIRPAPGKGGLSDYVPPTRDLALAWVNHLSTPEDSKYKISALIYVDAATGEMLGGSD